MLDVLSSFFFSDGYCDLLSISLSGVPLFHGKVFLPHVFSLAFSVFRLDCARYLPGQPILSFSLGFGFCFFWFFFFLINVLFSFFYFLSPLPVLFSTFFFLLGGVFFFLVLKEWLEKNSSSLTTKKNFSFSINPA